MSTLKIELEEIETQAEQLQSFLLMLEQTLIYDFYGGKPLLPAVSQMANIAIEITNKTAKLKKEVGVKHD